MAELKTTQNDSSVDAFLNSVEDEPKRSDAKAVCKLIQNAINEEPKMWGTSIIGFGTYNYTYPNGKEIQWMLTGFSPRKANLTIYIMTGFEKYADASGYNPQPLLDKLGPHTLGKSCLYIKRLEDIDQAVLKQLIKESVEHLRRNTK